MISTAQYRSAMDNLHRLQAGQLAGLGDGSAGAITSSAGGVISAASKLAGKGASPFLAIAGAVTELLGSIFSAVGVGTGCGQTCIVASDYANKAELQMKQNLAAWQALAPEQKTKTIQSLAVQNYDQLWDGLVRACSDPQLGTAGKRCVSDRDRNGKYPWAVYYRDPIAQTAVIDDTVPGLFSGIAAPASAGLTWLEQNWEIAVIAGLIGVLALSGSQRSGR